jgi:P-type conjugative transfer protein TrbG
MNRFTIASVSLAGVMLHAQSANPASNPVRVRRVEQAAPSTAPASNPDTQIRQRVARDLDAIKKSYGPSDTKPALKDGPTALPPSPSAPAELPLSPGAQAAVRVGEKWLTDTTSPTPGSDGRVVYSFGAGLPTMVCAPLRVCIVELQAGERLVGEPHIGDAVRWNVAPALYGNGESATTVVILKPQESGLDTNLLVTTDRRAYYLRLISKPEDYIARVAFAYPADEIASRKWREHVDKQEQQKREQPRITELPSTAPEPMNFDYTMRGDAQLRPVQVFDDGVRTYLRMPQSTRNQETPVLVVVGRDGKPEMLDYRVKGSMYIADRIFDRAQLVIGSGKKSRKAEVVRGIQEQH